MVKLSWKITLFGRYISSNALRTLTPLTWRLVIGQDGNQQRRRLMQGALVSERGNDLYENKLLEQPNVKPMTRVEDVLKKGQYLR